MSTVSIVFQCSSCGCWHDDEDEARECCAPTLIEGWRCDLCKAEYRKKADAEGCCGFVCVECGALNGVQDDVCKTCGHDPATDPIPQAVLEAAGQQRLAL